MRSARFFIVIILMISALFGARAFFRHQTTDSSAPAIAVAASAEATPASPTATFVPVQKNDPHTPAAVEIQTQAPSIDLLDYFRTTLYEGRLGTPAGGRFDRLETKWLGQTFPMIFFSPSASPQDMQVFDFDDAMIYLRYDYTEKARVLTRYEDAGPSFAPQERRGDLLSASKGQGRVFFPRYLTPENTGKAFQISFVMDRLWEKRKEIINRPSSVPQSILVWANVVPEELVDAKHGDRFPFFIRISQQMSECVIRQWDLAYHMGAFSSRILQNLNEKKCPNGITVPGHASIQRTVTGLPMKISIDAKGQKSIFIDEKQVETTQYRSRWSDENESWLVLESEMAKVVNPVYPEFPLPQLNRGLNRDYRNLPYGVTQMTDAQEHVLRDHLKRCHPSFGEDTIQQMIKSDFMAKGQSPESLCRNGR